MKETLIDYKEVVFEYLQAYSVGTIILRNSIINLLRAKYKIGASNKNAKVIRATDIMLRAFVDSGYAMRIARGKYAIVSKTDINFLDFYNKYIYGHRF